MTTDRDPTFEGTRTEQVNVQPPSRVESQAAGEAVSDAQSSSGFGYNPDVLRPGSPHGRRRRLGVRRLPGLDARKEPSAEKPT